MGLNFSYFFALNFGISQLNLHFGGKNLHFQHKFLKGLLKDYYFSKGLPTDYRTTLGLDLFFGAERTTVVPKGLHLVTLDPRVD